jgi:response regulator of citrate/malate metabolism
MKTYERFETHALDHKESKATTGIGKSSDYWLQVQPYLTGTPRTVNEIAKAAGVARARVGLGMWWGRRIGQVKETFRKGASGRVVSLYQKITTGQR